jgi:hypothetical protein
MTSHRFESAWETHLDEVAGRANYPATPDLERAVIAAVSREPSEAHPARGWTPRFAVAAALALFLLVATIAIPQTRTAVGEFFGLVEGERIEILPAPSPGISPTALPTAARIESFGAPFTFREVATAIGFEPALVNGEPPDAVYLVDYQGVAVAVFQYPDFDLWQTRTIDYGYFGKSVPVTNVIETPRVGERFGYWISGGSYVVRFINADGEEVIGSRRTIDRNALIWLSDAGTFYRLETSLSLEEALAIGATLP